LWQVVPWDLDLTWADNMYQAGQQGGDEPFKSPLLANFATPGYYPVIGIEFRNRVREIRDLLFNNDQAFQVVDEYARLIRGTNGGPTIADADRAQWDYNPKMANASYSSSPSKAGQGLYYQWPYEPTVPKSFEGVVQLMKNYINYRSTNVSFSLDTISADALRPNRPTVTYTGPSNFPINRLTFRCSSFSGVGGVFASMKWRIGEVTDTNLASFEPNEPWKYEITPVWESAELTAFNSDLTLQPAGLTVGHKYRVRVRMKDSTGRTSNWSPPVEFVAGQVDGAADLLNYLRITEVMYNPPPGGYEYIELHNLSATNTLQLAGAKFTAGIDFTFPIGTTLAPGGYLVVVGTTNLAAFRTYYGLSTSVPVIGAWSGSLANDGERLTLKTSSGGMEIVSFEYGTGRGWPLTAKGTGHSLVLLESAEEAQGAGAGEYGGNWRASTYLKGSPGSAEVVLPPAVVLNEVVSHTDFLSEEDSNDWIEIYNLTDAPLTLGPNWYLSDDGADLKKWMIPPATMIPGHGWVSFDEQTGFHFPTNSGFGLSKDGEQVFLSYLPGTAQDRVVDWLSFKAQENDWSFGRYPDGTGPWYTLTPRTRDVANPAPGPQVVINEIGYHPPDIGGTNDNGLDEFIEIWNATPNLVALWNAEGNWRLSGDVDYEFPGVALAAGEYLLVVHFDPVANPSQLAAFRALYGITNLSVRILGPCSGKLPNSSGRLALEKPQAPDIAGNPVGWVLVDEVLYADQGSWPTAADGSGDSLQRLGAAAYGSDPGNWVAQSPSAGVANATALTDSDQDGLPDWWENANGLNPRDPADALTDSDGDGMNALQEYLAGTNPRDRLSCLKLEAPVLLSARDSVVLRFNAVSNRSYTVQNQAGVAASGWSNVASFAAQATNATVVLTNSVSRGGGSSFYRLVTPRLP
ncbi:MAG TPA: lamin tail domain-containing protein, partial [Candidatus Sulfotelmatobacter sp.]|nr:lamin tail domain-containing protein [Candidatus Sulfotelmatobacter sp.]